MATTDVLEELLHHFSALFAESMGLPLVRHRCHWIRLLLGTSPVAGWPYRYAHHQKQELERQCATMLGQGVIQSSLSVFATPVLLIKKANGSWRFCVNCRAFNAKTDKDKFLILVVEELLNELHSAKFFSKLDLRSGYHQVLMHHDDVGKTTFQTHEGLFEFLVMPFRLTNAPSTLQELMNDVL
jgi:hypothetical protein